MRHRPAHCIRNGTPGSITQFPGALERHLRRILEDYFSRYHRWRCHQSLEMDCPEPRAVQTPEVGEEVEVVEAGGLYRHYERVAA